MRLLHRLGQHDLSWAVLLLALFLLVFFSSVWLTGRALLPVDLIFELDPVWREHAPAGFEAPGNRLLADQVYQYYPWKAELWRAFSERRVPLWTPSINLGQPLMANGQSGVWDPFWLLAHLVSLKDAFFVVAVLKLLTAGLSTFLLARQLGVSRRGATLAMITFTFSGPLIVWLGFPLSNVIVWLPLLLYLSERALVSRSAESVVAAGVVLAFQFFGGHPETSFHIVLTWIAFCIVRAVAIHGWRRRPLSRALVGMALVGSIGLALAAVQILPLVEGVLNSSNFRSRQATAPTGTSVLRTIMVDWQTWPTIVVTVLPQFFGSPIDNTYWYPYTNYNEQNAYVGIVPLALGLVTTWHWWRNRRGETASDRLHERPVLGERPLRDNARAFFIGLTCMALGIALALPIFNVVSVLPAVNLVDHGRLRMVYVLGMALLAGFGLDTLAAARRSTFDTRQLFLVVVGALATTSLLGVGAAFVGLDALRSEVIAYGRSQVETLQTDDHPLYYRPMEYYHEQAEARYRRMRRLYTPRTPRMFVPLGVALAVGSLELGRRRGWNQGMLCSGLVLLTGVDLFLFGVNLNPTVDKDQVYPQTEAIEFLQGEDGIFRVGGLYLSLMPNSGMVFGLSDARGNEPVVPWRPAALIDHVPRATRLSIASLLRAANSRLLDLMNVQYLVTDRELADAFDVGSAKRWELVYAEQGGVVRVYRNRDVLPRAFVVQQAEFVASPEAALGRLLEEGFDFRTRVILEGMPPQAALPATSSKEAAAQIVSYEAERVVVETDNPDAGWLILSDSYMPGWRVQVDGEDAPLYVADFAFRGVLLPEGRHQVVFTYRPASYVWGARISLTMLVLLIGAGVGLMVQRQRSIQNAGRAN